MWSAIFAFIGGIAGNLVAGWIQQDVFQNVFNRKRLFATFLVAIASTFIGVYLESNNRLPQFGNFATATQTGSGNQTNNFYQTENGTIAVNVGEDSASSDWNETRVPLIISRRLFGTPFVSLDPSDVGALGMDYQNPNTFDRAVFFPRTGQFLEIQIENQLEEREVRLSEFALVQLLEYDSFGPQQAFFTPPMGGDGWDKHHEFRITLRPESIQRIQKAIPEEPQSGDYYTVRSGVVEVVAIYFSFCDPGTYTIKGGAEYIFDGKRTLIWSDPVTIAVPERYYVHQYPPDFEGPLETIEEASPFQCDE